MKISRFKKAHKILKFFSTNFQYREPYLVLIDGTFCQAALLNKVHIEEQLKKYFQTLIRFVTTQCIILEAESIGGPLVTATKIVKQFQVHKCGHEGKPIPAAECIKSMTKQARYIVATQDRALKANLQKVPGRCLLHLNRATPVLEEPSVASKKWVTKKCQELIIPANMKTTVTVKPELKIKKKRLKNPNPLSCKKKKDKKAKQKKDSKKPSIKISNKAT